MNRRCRLSPAGRRGLRLTRRPTICSSYFYRANSEQNEETFSFRHDLFRRSSHQSRLVLARRQQRHELLDYEPSRTVASHIASPKSPRDGTPYLYAAVENRTQHLARE